ncbi:zinc ribbon domain-containing protein [bacterium]|nr:zinc ribbon domain-containing protein [bacterium]
MENAFEPLIDRHVYEVVVHLLGRDTRKTADGIALLSGLVECADCHQSMVRKSPDKKNYYYICSTYLYEKECVSHSFSEKKLIAAVKESIRYYVSVIVNLEKALSYVRNASLPEQRMFDADQQLKVLEQECSRIMQIKKNLYESYCEGLLDEEEFKSYKKSYDADLKQKEAAIKKQRESISDMMSMMDRRQEWMKYFFLYKDMEEIDRTMITMLVKRIRVHSDKSISIEFWFEDEFERLMALLETANTIEPNSALASFLAHKKGGNQSA